MSKLSEGARRQFAHLTLDRAKPGVIAIDRTGRRFTNDGQFLPPLRRGLAAALPDGAR